jgi:mannose-6-phosphate isomerase-like protein (cupin superfamily)
VTDGYDINLDDKFGQLTLIDVGAEAAAHEPWFNQTLTSVNDAVVRLGVIEGDFHWHSHDAEDEFFLVLEGELVIEIEGHVTPFACGRTRASRCRAASRTRRARRCAR